MKCVPLVLFLVLSSCSAVFPYQKPASDAIPEDFIIGLQDVLMVNVWREPDLSVKEVLVRSDGKIGLPLIGDIQASGLTPKQLQLQIAERMKEFVAAPNVTVIMQKISSQSVSIVGQVAKPGPYFLGAPLTVLELLARAGGLREDAKSKKIAIVRKEGEQTIHLLFNYKEVSAGRNLKQNIYLRNGDVVIVP